MTETGPRRRCGNRAGWLWRAPQGLVRPLARPPVRSPVLCPSDLLPPSPWSQAALLPFDESSLRCSS